MHLLTGGAGGKNVCFRARAEGIPWAATDIADGGGFGAGSDNVLSGGMQGNGGDGIHLTGSQSSTGKSRLGNGDDGLDDPRSPTRPSPAAPATRTATGASQLGPGDGHHRQRLQNNGYGIGPGHRGTGDEGGGTVAFTGNRVRDGRRHHDVAPGQLHRYEP
jgi:hypothetical protein